MSNATPLSCHTFWCNYVSFALSLHRCGCGRVAKKNELFTWLPMLESVSPNLWMKWSRLPRLLHLLKWDHIESLIEAESSWLWLLLSNIRLRPLMLLGSRWNHRIFFGVQHISHRTSIHLVDNHYRRGSISHNKCSHTHVSFDCMKGAEWSKDTHLIDLDNRLFRHRSVFPILSDCWKHIECISNYSKHKDQTYHHMQNTRRKDSTEEQRSV